MTSPIFFEKDAPEIFVESYVWDEEAGTYVPHSEAYFSSDYSKEPQTAKVQSRVRSKVKRGIPKNKLPPYLGWAMKSYGPQQSILNDSWLYKVMAYKYRLYPWKRQETEQ